MHIKNFSAKHLVKHLSTLATILVCTVHGAQAENMFISDILVVNVRDNLEPSALVVDRVMSDSSVTVLEKNGQFLFIETASGKQGWISSQYVTSEPPKSIIIQQLKEEISELQQINSALQLAPTLSSEPLKPAKEDETLASITKERDTLAHELDLVKKEASLQASHASERTELTDLNNNYISLQQQYSLLLKDKESLEQQLASTRTYTPKLNAEPGKDTYKSPFISFIRGDFYNNNTIYTIYWFFAGALVFLTGILSGKFSGRRKNRFRF
jgi:SH3 domain protein